MHSPDLKTAYESVPYDDRPHIYAHVRRLETHATLAGLSPAPITACRALEIGCASGANLIPQAFDLPGSEFVGIDLSPLQIERAKARVKELALTNIELRAEDLLTVGRELGQFDYIIAHGVYSWTPAPVRDKLMSICKANLTPRGIAYVSYNVHPGWHARMMLRQILQYHTARFQKAEEQIAQARGLVDYLAEHCAQTHGWREQLDHERDHVRKLGDAQLMHDHLELVNQPVFFNEFLAHAQRHGLAYVGDAMLPAMFPPPMDPKAMEPLRQMPWLEREQFLDFLLCREFRRSLISHAEVKADLQLTPQRLERFSLSLTQPLTDGNVDINSEAPVILKNDKAEIETRQPVMKAAIDHLNAIWPQTSSLAELRVQAQDRLSPPHRSRHLQGPSGEAGGGDPLGAGLLVACLAGLVGLDVTPPKSATLPGERPIATRLARVQAASETYVTNRRHEFIIVDDESRRLIRLLDGTRNLTALTDEMRRASQGAGTVGGGSPSSIDMRLRVQRLIAAFARRSLIDE